MRKMLSLKLGIIWEHQNIKTFLQKFTFKIGPKNFLLLRKLEILSRGNI